jgi:hypothetical protein
MTPEERADAIVDGILYEGWHGPRARESIAAAIRAEGEHWKETYNITVNNMANEQDALRAENAKLRAENGLLMAENRTESERLKEACDGYLGHAAGLRDYGVRLSGLLTQEADLLKPTQPCKMQTKTSAVRFTNSAPRTRS